MVQKLFVMMLILGFSLEAKAKDYVLSGKVIDADNGQPVEYASILIAESGLWAITDNKGTFTIKNVKELIENAKKQQAMFVTPNDLYCHTTNTESIGKLMLYRYEDVYTP
jgi:hypothetical protein